MSGRFLILHCVIVDWCIVVSENWQVPHTTPHYCRTDVLWWVSTGMSHILHHMIVHWCIVVSENWQVPHTTPHDCRTDVFWQEGGGGCLMLSTIIVDLVCFCEFLWVGSGWYDMLHDCIAWGSSPHVNTLLSVQKRAARIILDIKDIWPHENRLSILFSQLGWMPIYHRIDFN